MTQPAPSSHLMQVILDLVTPILATGGIADARLAATEAIAACDTGDPRELIAAGQIAAFALTALDSLRLSMPEDLALAMKLKLRGNAATLDRTARDTAKLLENARRTAPFLDPGMDGQAPWNEPAPAPAPAPRATPPAPTGEHQNRLLWAGAMKNEAARLQSGIASAPPAQRKIDSMWIDVLNNVASDLEQGNYPSAAPGTSKAELLRTTLMSGGTSFPSHLITPTKR